MKFLLGFNFIELIPTILVYAILSILALGVIYLFKKKSDKELKELEGKMDLDDKSEIE